MVFRAVKGEALTHDELDQNFRESENLRGTEPPTNDIGYDGSHYTLYEHFVTLDAYSSQIVLEYYSVSNAWVFSDASCCELPDLGNSYFYNTLDLLMVLIDEPDYIRFNFDSEVVQQHNKFSFLTYDFDFYDFELIDSSYYRVYAPGILDKIIEYQNNNTPMVFDTYITDLIHHRDYVKKIGTWEEYDLTRLIKNIDGLSLDQIQILDIANQYTDEQINLVELASGLSTGLAQVSGENGAEGWGLIGRTESDHVPTGNRAIDLTYDEVQSTVESPHGASGDHSFATGSLTHASARASAASGTGTKAINESSFVVGKYNVGQSTETIVEVGIGIDDASRANALEIYKNGEIVAPMLTPNKIVRDHSFVTKKYIDDLIINCGTF